MKVAKYSKKILLVLYYYEICKFYFIRKKSLCVIQKNFPKYFIRTFYF